jgi:hypothetical protein
LIGTVTRQLSRWQDSAEDELKNELLAHRHTLASRLRINSSAANASRSVSETTSGAGVYVPEIYKQIKNETPGIRVSERDLLLDSFENLEVTSMEVK